MKCAKKYTHFLSTKRRISRDYQLWNSKQIHLLSIHFYLDSFFCIRFSCVLLFSIFSGSICAVNGIFFLLTDINCTMEKNFNVDVILHLLACLFVIVLTCVYINWITNIVPPSDSSNAVKNQRNFTNISMSLLFASCARCSVCNVYL